MQRSILALTLAILATAFAPATHADLDDPEGVVTLHGIVRELAYAENECADIPDANEYKYFLETADGEKLCLTPEPTSGITSFKYYLNKAVSLVGELCCGFPKVVVHSITLDEGNSH